MIVLNFDATTNDFALTGAPGDTVSEATFSTSGKTKQQVYNIRDYGAVGNGTTDDTIAVQAAIDACVNATYGGTVFIPPGRYKITASLTTPSTNPKVSLRGVGATVSTLYWPTDLGVGTHAIDFGAVTDSGTQPGLYDMQLEGPGSDFGTTKGSSSNQMSAIRFNARFRAERCRFWKWKYGVYMWGDHQTLFGCKWRSCYYNIYFPVDIPTQGDHHIIDNRCDGATFASIGIATADLNFQINRSHFGFSPFGFYIEAGGSMRRCTFRNNIFEAIGNSCIYGETGTTLTACIGDMVVKHASADAIGGYPTDGYINVPTIKDCDLQIDGTLTSGTILGGTAGCIVKGDMSDSRFNLTKQFWTDVIGAGVVSPFKFNNSGSTGEPANVTVKIGGAEANLLKTSAAVAAFDVCELVTHTTIKPYQTTSYTPMVAGVAMHASAISLLVPVQYKGTPTLKTTSGAITTPGLVIPDTANPGKCILGTSVLSFGQAVAADVAGAVVVRLRGGT